MAKRLNKEALQDARNLMAEQIHPLCTHPRLVENIDQESITIGECTWCLGKEMQQVMDDIITRELCMTRPAVFIPPLILPSPEEIRGFVKIQDSEGAVCFEEITQEEFKKRYGDDDTKEIWIPGKTTKISTWQRFRWWLGLDKF